MADLPRIPVCTWPDGRVLYRTPAYPRLNATDVEIIQFSLGSDDHAGRDAVFSFFMSTSGNVLPRTFPGLLNFNQLDSEFDGCIRQILWFLRIVGLAGPDQVLPRRVFRNSSKPVLLPGALPFRVEQAPSFDLERLDQEEVADLVSRTFPSADMSLVDWSAAVQAPMSGLGAGKALQFSLRSNLVPALRLLRVSVRPTSGLSWMVFSQELEQWGWSKTGTGRGHTLGGAFLALMRDAHILVGDQAMAWAAALEPGTLLVDDEILRLLGEPGPAMWPMDRLSAWVSGE